MRLSVAFAAAVAAISAISAPEDWYTPKGGWLAGDAGAATVVIGGKDVRYDVGYDGISLDLLKKINEYQCEGAYELANALQTLQEALQAQIMVRNMAENLNDLFTGGNAEISATDGSSNPNGSYKFSVGENGKIELSLKGVSAVTAGGGLTKSGGTIGLSGWGGGAQSGTLADALSGRNPAIGFQEVLVRIGGAGGSLGYHVIGSGLDGGGAQADGVTISTNAAGALEIHNWTSEGKGKADDCAIPYADSASGGIKWGRFFGFFNGDLFDWDGDDDRVTLEGWTANMGTRHYFGTGDTKGEFGFHELPNVTTNRVEGDGLTIDSTTDAESGGEVKKLGLLGWPPASPGLPYAVGADGEGRLVFMPLPEQLTNGTAFAYDDLSLSSNESDRVEIKGWGAESAESDTLADILTGAGSGSSSGEGAFEVVARSGGAGGSLKYISVGDGIAKPDDDQFAVDGGKFKIASEEGKFLRGTANNGVEWVTMAGDTAVDNASISTNAAGSLEIKGFASASACGAPLSDMLNDPNGAEAKSHLFLAKKTGAGGELHYVEIGSGVGSGQVDGESLKTNSVGKVEIAGFKEAGAAGTSPVSTGSGIEWRNTAAAIRVVGSDGSSAVVGSGGLTNSIAFMPDVNSNVTVTVSGDGSGNATVTIGVRWR